MATASERIPVLMTLAEKSRLVTKARKAGLSTSEYIRRATEEYLPVEDEKALDAMILEMSKATLRAEKAIEDTLAYIAESNRRITEMESRNNRGAI